jgi:hypothetical protein
LRKNGGLWLAYPLHSFLEEHHFNHEILSGKKTMQNRKNAKTASKRSATSTQQKSSARKAPTASRQMNRPMNRTMNDNDWQESAPRGKRAPFVSNAAKGAARTSQRRASQ